MSWSTHRPRRAALVAAVAALTAATVVSCAGGAIGQNPPASDGAGVVTGDPGATLFGAGGPAAPKISGTSLTGTRIRLASYAGHVLVLNFWGSWCADCRREAPALGALASHFAAAGVRFLGVDVRDLAVSARAFDRSYRISYPSLSDPAGEITLAFRDTVAPTAVPTTLVIGANGHIGSRVMGLVSYDSLARLIRQAVIRPS